MAMNWSMYMQLYAQIAVGFLVLCFVSCSSEQELMHQHQPEDYYSTEFTFETDVIKRQIQFQEAGYDHESGDTELESHSNSTSSKENEENCTSLQHHSPMYNSSCELVHTECRGKVQLINYLSFVVCDLKSVQVFHIAVRIH